MNATATTIAAIAATFALYGSRGGRAPRGLALVTLLLITSQFLLVEQNVGPVPVRVLSFVIAIIYLGYDLLVRRNCLRTGDERILISLWAVFALAVFVAQWSNGSISGAGEIIDFVSRYGFALVLFALVAGLARTRSGAFLIATWIFMIAAANFLFVAGQLLDVPGAMQVHEQLYPETQALESALVAEGLITSFGYLPGLSAYSIATGYVFTCFSVLGFALAERRTLTARVLLSCFSGAIALLGGAMILSRSTILVGGIAGIAALVWTARSSAGRVGVIWLSVVAGVVLVSMSVAILGVAAENIPGFQRVQTLQDSARLKIYASALRFFTEHPLVGGAVADRVAAGLPIGAHNFILNAAVNFGLLGLIPMMAVIFGTLWKGLQATRSTIGTPVRALVACTYICMIAYLLKGLFHNESVATSGIIYALLAGLTIGAAAEADLKARMQRPVRRLAGTPAA